VTDLQPIWHSVSLQYLSHDVPIAQLLPWYPPNRHAQLHASAQQNTSSCAMQAREPMVKWADAKWRCCVFGEHQKRWWIAAVLEYTNECAIMLRQWSRQHAGDRQEQVRAHVVQGGCEVGIMASSSSSVCVRLWSSPLLWAAQHFVMSMGVEDAGGSAGYQC
jgi:hypothetical protein